MVHYYVNSDTGNDANDGSEGSPVATLTQAFTLIDAVEVSDKGPHEVIITNDGIYNEGALGLSPLLSFDTIVYVMAQTGSDTGLPVVTPTIQGSGSSVQQRAFYAGRDWLIKGLKFENWVVSVNNGIIEQRSHGFSDPTNVELCEFTKITGSCFTVDLGSSDNGPYILQNNTFHDILVPSASNSDIILFGNPKKCHVFNNVFYDIQFGNVSAAAIKLAGTRGPENIISHNTFGTSSVQADTTVNPSYYVNATYAKFEYNIIYEQTANTGLSTSTFARIDNGEANYNIYYNVSGQSVNAPFGGTDAPTGSSNNREIDPQLKGPLVGNSANYKLASTSSPAFDAAIGSSDVTTDRTGRNRTTLDRTALNTGIFDIGAYELTGLWNPDSEQPDSQRQINGDYTINRLSNASNQFVRGAGGADSSSGLGRNLDQVPFSVGLNGAIPSAIITLNKQPSGKKGS